MSNAGYADLCASIIRTVQETPLQEQHFGRSSLSQASARVAAAIPQGVAEVVQVACVIEAIEHEDYAEWPDSSFLLQLVPELIATVTLACAEPGLLGAQRSQYQELSASPKLLQNVTHGLSKKLDLADKKAFVDELIGAGRRQIDRADEANAPVESGVLHVALSYRHTSSYDHGGTIDIETAEEAFEVVSNLVKEHNCTRIIRMWIDQNLHRYDKHGPWYERGFLPYAMFPVISALGKHGGFAIGRTRPWIWVETGMAVSSFGIHCKPAITQSAFQIVEFPAFSGRSSMHYFLAHGSTLGVSTLFLAVRQILTAVSWWSPGVLEHKNYEYVGDFSHFVLWARAQIVRLDRTGHLDLSSDSFNDTMLESIAWMKALPAPIINRQQKQLPYLRLEMNVENAREQLSLLKLTGSCEVHDGVSEIAGRKAGHVFCFLETATTLSLNVNPSQLDPSVRLRNVEGSQELAEDFWRFSNWQGGFSIWDKRFAGKGRPRFSRCGSLFDRYFGVLESIGVLEEEVVLGGEHFYHDSYMLQGTRVERVYRSYEADVDVFLSESDVLCALRLDASLQEKFIAELWPKHALPAVRRILQVSEGESNVALNARTLGTFGGDVLDLVQRYQDDANVSRNELLVRRMKIGAYQYLLSIKSNRYGEMSFGFNCVLDVEGLGHLIGFKTAGDVQMTLAKIRLMMGSTEFIPYRANGLSAGLGIMHRGEKKYPLEMSLEGSEFQLCFLCSAVFSPVNMHTCVLKCCLASRRIFCSWVTRHICPKHVSNTECGIIGVLG